MKIEEVFDEKSDDIRDILPYDHYKKLYYQLMISLIDIRLKRLKSMINGENLLRLTCAIISGFSIADITKEAIYHAHSFKVLIKWKRIYELELRKLY